MIKLRALVTGIIVAALFNTVSSILITASAQAKKTLSIGMVQFPPDLHPNITVTSVKDTILATSRRAMTGFTDTGEVICQLCTEVPSVANGRAKVIKRADGTEGMEVFFTLKDNLFWADGVQVTAKDVVFGFEVEKAFSVPPTVESVVAVDDLNVKVVLKVVRYDFDRSAPTPISEHIEGEIFRSATNPLDYGQKSLYNRKPEEPGLWMGPFRVTEFRSNESVTIMPNPFWKGEQPYFEKITFRLVENTSALQANLMASGVDMVASGNIGLTLDQHLSLMKTATDKFNWDFVPSVASYEHLAVQFDHSVLADVKVRQAIQMGIDRKTIVAKIFGNKFEVADSFKHPTQFGWSNKTKIYPYDPKAAKELLAQAGYKPGNDGILVNTKGEKLSLDLVSTSGNRIRELVEQVIQTQMKAIGIEIVIKNEPARLMFGETLRRRNFKGLVQFQTDAALDTVPYIYFHSSQIPSEQNSWTGLNYMGYKNPEMDAALMQAWAALDPEVRRIAWKKIMDITMVDLPEIYLYFPTVAILTPKWMTGVVNEKRWGLNTLWIEQWRAK
jgi:peptide/nickel transport system substrate-binding protein